MKKILALVACVVLLLSFTACGETTYEDALNIVKADVEANGTDIGDGQTIIMRDFQYTTGSSSTFKLGVSTTKSGSVMIAVFRDYDPRSYGYYLDSEDLFVEFKPDNETVHPYTFILAIDGQITGEERISGVVDASTYTASTILTSDEYSDPDNLVSMNVVGKEGLEENASHYLEELLTEFQAYLDDIDSGLTVADFGFTSFVTEPTE